MAIEIKKYVDIESPMFINKSEREIWLLLTNEYKMEIIAENIFDRIEKLEAKLLERK